MATSSAGGEGAASGLVTPGAGRDGFRPPAPPSGCGIAGGPIDSASHYSNGCHQTSFPVSSGGNGGEGIQGREPGAEIPRQANTMGVTSLASRGSGDASRGGRGAELDLMNNNAVQGVNIRVKDRATPTTRTMSRNVGSVVRGACAQVGRVDDRSRVEQLLIISGIEQNPGPGREGDYSYPLLTILSYDASLWIFDTARWASKTDKFHDRTRALLKQFRPGSMPHRRIARMATELSQRSGEGVNDETRWTALVKAVRELLPHNALLEQDYLSRMSRKPNEAWIDFIDRYFLYAETCSSVSEHVKAAELYRKLPRELQY